uniref:uncharacterized protein LOC122592071 n=1 Tax=Erigeron canadensis TaxID=72917 RepID=UPI001CB96423|nr:uncharacterized protein LOC122592071 [Erigeron canadensis]
MILYDKIRQVGNLSSPTGDGLTHSYRIFPSLFENISQPGATTGQELTQPVKNISVLTGKALAHNDGIFSKDFDELHSDMLDVARSNCSKAIREGDLPHSDRITPTRLEKMFRPSSEFSWSMDEVLMLGDRIYPMQFNQMSKPAYNFSFSIKDTKMLGGRYYPLKINIRKEVQCLSDTSLGGPMPK